MYRIFGAIKDKLGDRFRSKAAKAQARPVNISNQGQPLVTPRLMCSNPKLFIIRNPLFSHRYVGIFDQHILSFQLSTMYLKIRRVEVRQTAGPHSAQLSKFSFLTTSSGDMAYAISAT